MKRSWSSSGRSWQNNGTENISDMIPEHLTIKGLYSYQEEQEIDFTTLTGAGLFGIFGRVGSGKSSILEAIVYALYGDTERLNRRENRGYNMMNLRSGELSIRFIFRHRDERYMFTVRGRRNRRQFEKVDTFERSAYIEKEGDGAPSTMPAARGSWDFLTRTSAGR